MKKHLKTVHKGLITGGILMFALFAFAGNIQAATISGTNIAPNENSYLGWHEGYINTSTAYSVHWDGLHLGDGSHSQILNGLVNTGEQGLLTSASDLGTLITGASVDVVSATNGVLFQIAVTTDGGWGTIEPATRQTETGGFALTDNWMTSRTIGDVTKEVPMPLEDLLASLETQGDFRYSGFGIQVDDSTIVKNIVWDSEEYDFTSSITVCASGCDYITIQEAIDSAISGDTIILESNITADSQINVNKNITIDGNGKTLSPSFTKTDNSNNSVIGIQSNNVTIKNLTVDGTNGTNLHGINVYVSTGVILDSVTLTNNDHDGLVVNGSTVTVNNITTSNNGWDGMDVDQGSGVTSEAKLTVTGTSSHNETYGAIRIDDIDKASVVDSAHQYSYVDDAPARIYSLVGETETVPDEEGNVEVSDDSTTVVVSNTSTPITIAAGSTENASVNYSSLVSAGSGSVPKTTINSDVATVIIPATTITSSGSWDGTIELPHVVTDAVTPTVASGKIANVIKSIEVGFGDTPLSLNAPAKLVFPGESGSMIGWSQGGVFKLIENACQFAEGEDSPTLDANADCRQIVGSDLVVWTRHFTTFTTYTEASAPSTNSSVSSSGGSHRSVESSATTSVTSNTTAPQIGEVLGAEITSPEIQAQINSIKSQLVTLIGQLIVLLQAEIAAQS